MSEPGFCPAPDCGRPIALTSVCCLTHWKALPRGLRLKLGRFERRSLPQAHAEAMKKAHRVWAEGPEHA